VESGRSSEYNSFPHTYWSSFEQRVIQSASTRNNQKSFHEARATLRRLEDSMPSEALDMAPSASRHCQPPQSRISNDLRQSVWSNFKTSGSYVGEAYNVRSLTHRDGVYYWSSKIVESSGTVRADAYTCVGDIAIFYNIATREGEVDNTYTSGSGT
jgi:hypothetical protein